MWNFNIVSLNFCTSFTFKNCLAQGIMTKVLNLDYFRFIFSINNNNNNKTRLGRQTTATSAPTSCPFLNFVLLAPMFISQQKFFKSSYTNINEKVCNFIIWYTKISLKKNSSEFHKIFTTYLIKTQEVIM